MRVVKDVMRKTMACPFCVNPLADDTPAYVDHLIACRGASDVEKRSVVFRRIRHDCPYASDHELYSEYMGFVQHDASLFPRNWKVVDQRENCRLIPVAKDSEEIRHSLLKRVDSIAVCHVERCQNKELYLRYSDRKAGAREAWLFHGSKPDIYNLILQSGFDRGCSKNGAYGYGIYLSSTHGYSLKYTTPCVDAPIKMRLLLCRVLLRDDTVIEGNIHVVQHDFDVYPEYVVHFKM